MAETITREQVLEHQATPGSEGGKVQQAPFQAPVGPRDALIVDGRNEQDFVPDASRLHVGFVPQPTFPVRDGAGNVIGYLAAEDVQQVLEVPAKPITLRDLKQHHNATEAGAEWQKHIQPVGPAPLGEEDSYAYNSDGGDDSGRVKAAREATSAREKDAPIGKGKAAKSDKAADADNG